MSAEKMFLLIKKNIKFDIKLIDKKLSLYNLKFNFKDFKNRVERMKGLYKVDLKNLMIGELQDFEELKKELFDKLK